MIHTGSESDESVCKIKNGPRETGSQPVFPEKNTAEKK